MEYITYFINNIQIIMSLFFKTVGLTIVSFVMIVIIDYVYIKRVLNGGVKVSAQFSNLMFLPILPLGFEMLRTFLIGIDIHDKLQSTIYIMDKIVIITSLIWVILFIIYLISIIVFKVKNIEYIPKKENKIRWITNSVVSVISIIISFIITNNNSIITGGVVYLTGTVFDIVKIVFAIGITLCTILFILNRKKLPNVYIMPIVFIDILYLILVSLESFATFYTTYITSFFVFIIMALFFTIESQDGQILEDYMNAIEKEKKLKKGKRNFLNNASHEIRTSIYLIKGYSDLLLGNDDTLTNDIKLKDIENSSIRLKNIVENLVHISYIEKEKVTVKQDTYDFNALYNKIITDIKNNNLNEMINLNFDAPNNIQNKLYGDKDKIYNIITKIIYNAIYNTKFGEVQLKITEQQLDQNYKKLIFTIINSGNTMTEEMYKKDFNDYIIENNNINNEIIGLLVAKSYIDMLGGDIKFISNENSTEYIVSITQKIII